MKEKAYLIGPFLGELEWEYRYFAPYVINLMKTDPERVYIVFTRPERFDLYGKYADIFVPLRVGFDKPHRRDCFTIKGMDETSFNVFLRAFIQKYKKRYRIIDKIYPEVSYFSYKVKWQFPKSKMDYDFAPRIANKNIVKSFVTDHEGFVDMSSKYVDEHVTLDNYNLKYSLDLGKQIKKSIDNNTCSALGCTIEALKRVEFVIGNLSTDISRLALLLKKPLITLKEQLSEDSINLINPFNTPIIKCDDIKEGIKIYEDTFRS